MTKLYVSTKIPRELGEIEIFTKKQLEAVRHKMPGADFIEFELGKHSVYKPMPSYYGWSPHFSFDDAGFKLETHFDLIAQFAENIDSGKPFGPCSMSTEPRKAVEFARTQELYEASRLKIEQVYNKLNAENTPFVVFRDFRRFPAVWDNVYFYSRGDFKI